MIIKGEEEIEEEGIEEGVDMIEIIDAGEIDMEIEGKIMGVGEIIEEVEEEVEEETVEIDLIPVTVMIIIEKTETEKTENRATKRIDLKMIALDHHEMMITMIKKTEDKVAEKIQEIIKIKNIRETKVVLKTEIENIRKDKIDPGRNIVVK